MSNPLVGSTVLVSITVTDPDTGDPTDATVSLVIRDPDGNESTETPTHAGTGEYEYYLPLDDDGWWYAIWTVTSGGLTTVKECGVCANPTVLVGS